MGLVVDWSRNSFIGNKRVLLVAYLFPKFSVLYLTGLLVVFYVRSIFLVAPPWFRLGELDKIATNSFLHVKPWKKICGRKFFWLPRLITWPEISHRNCSKWPKKTFFANYRWTGNHRRKRKKSCISNSVKIKMQKTVCRYLV